MHRTLSNAPGWVLCLEMAKCVNYTLPYGLRPIIWQEGQGHRKNMIGKLVTRIFGGKVCVWTPLQGKKMWRYLGPVWMLTKRIPQSRGILIIRQTGCSALWIPVGHPDYSIITQRAHEQSGHAGRDGGYAWTPRPTWLQPLLSDQTISSRDQPRAPDDEPATWGHVDYIRPLP